VSERYISPVQKSTRTFSAGAESVRAARQFVSETAEHWGLGAAAWPLVQVVSELASNAVLHAGTDFTVRIAREGDATRLEVVDHSPRRAQSRGYDLDATTGRGLRLVETLSREWGVSSAPDGKAVWAVIDADSGLSGESEQLAELFLTDENGDALKKAPRKTAKPRSRRARPSDLAAA
jgi:anti-sigma regulatory factor (Ser/Thr protein kinase)